MTEVIQVHMETTHRMKGVSPAVVVTPTTLRIISSSGGFVTISKEKWHLVKTLVDRALIEYQGRAESNASSHSMAKGGN